MATRRPNIGVKYTVGVVRRKSRKGELAASEVYKSQQERLPFLIIVKKQQAFVERLQGPWLQAQSTLLI